MEGFQTDDIQIIIRNDSVQNITVGLFDTVEDKRPIKVGSILIGSTVQEFFYGNTLLLDKKYILHHYVDPKNINSAAIYNFKPGVYLSALEDVFLYPETDQHKLYIRDQSSVYITISTTK